MSDRSATDAGERDATGGTRRTLVGAGIALGAGVGVTTASLLGSDVALGAGYGVACGIVVAAAIVSVAGRRPSLEETRRSLLAVGAGAGAIAGAAIAGAAAWGSGEAVSVGLLAGIPGGVALGLFLAWLYAP